MKNNFLIPLKRDGMLHIPQMMRNRIYGLVFMVMAVFVFSGCSFDKGEKMYESGKQCFQSGNYFQASQYFKNAIEIKSDKAEYYIAYGMSLLMERKYEASREQFEKAVVDKDNSIVKKNNQQAYRGMGICSLRAGDFELAVSELSRAMELGGDAQIRKDICFYLCEAYVALSDYNSAKKVINEQISENESADAYGILGWICFEGEDYEVASVNYEKAISMQKSGHPEWYLGIYQSFVMLGEKEKAGEYLQKALKLKAGNDEEKLVMARLILASGDNRTAKQNFEEISEKNPKAFYYLGVLAQKEEDYGSACEYYEKYEQSAAEAAAEDTKLRLGVCREAMENYDMALEAYREGMEHKGPYQKELYVRYISLCERTGDFEEAYKAADEYLSENADDRIEREKVFLSTRTE